MVTAAALTDKAMRFPVAAAVMSWTSVKSHGFLSADASFTIFLNLAAHEDWHMICPGHEATVQLSI